MLLDDYQTRSIELVIYRGFKAFEAIGPMTVFSYANRILESYGYPPGYRVAIRSSKIGPVPSDTIMTLDATIDLEMSTDAHSILVVGAHYIENAVIENPSIIEWIHRAAPSTPRFAALCSGAFFLAATGLLNGRRATTHWRMNDAFAKKYPEVKLDIDSIYIRDANFWTSAGVSASIDLALAFVEEDHGHRLALEVAQDLVIFLKRPGGQSQFSANLVSQRTQNTSMREIQNWVIENLNSKMSVASMAERSAMSTRHFTRTFSKEVGMCPSQFLDQARIDHARRLLSGGSLPIKTVSFMSGFTSADHMRLAFKKFLSVTPKEYRDRFTKA
ncbi:GlxA family transcriptional regulator [Pseudomonas sp. S60]|uniref:GlxA family transcriptional regulator n=1 Tax=unclassified Pseudomonas TaxID=196821 RepID=UPI0019114520|nr:MULTISPECIES: helix-turn-helix domain-containing protein [unclassified Pseudomonas]MBK5006350.1 GlxA family transcriptional regulator [Pseudomonas sp. S32]MBK5009485.1 GlxA family transcriptional regulator [Pseudomonas sp. S60]